MRPATHSPVRGLLVALVTGALWAAVNSPAAARQAAEPEATQVGLASYYSRRLEGRRTASGKAFSNEEMVAAHASYPLGTLVRVTNLEKDRSVEVRIIDRGASRQNRREGVIIDVSQAAARVLDMKKDGRVRVRVEVLSWGDDYHKPLTDVPRRRS